MKKPIAIIAGEPNSISSEIIFKCWKLNKKFNHKPYFIIGSKKLLNLQMKKLGYKIKIKEIFQNFSSAELNTNELPVFNIDFNQKKPFEKISIKSNKYIFKCFDKAIELAKHKRIIGFINCPVSKETLFRNKHQGITEYLAKKFKKKGSEVMLIYNKKLSVSPITTHIPLNQVNKKINKKKIVSNVNVINKFYRKFFNKKPFFGILGLNPHNYYTSKNAVEKKIINSSIKEILKLNIKVKGPVSTDSSFMFLENKFDVIIGMYHDQVLTPFKAIYNFDAINITLGLPLFRISPDHGVGSEIAGRKIANPKSLVKSIEFFNSIK